MALTNQLTSANDTIKTDDGIIYDICGQLITANDTIQRNISTISDICGRWLADESTIVKNNITMTRQSGQITDLSNQVVIDNQVSASILSNLYNGVSEQNQAMEDTIYTLNTGNVDKEKANYQYQQIYNLAYRNKYLIWMYFTIVIYVVYLIVKKEWNTYLKTAVAVLFIAYPFYIGQLENAIVVFFSYIFSMVNANVYTPNNY